MATIHPDLTNTATYAHLRGSDLELLRDAVANRDNWHLLLSVLVSFASEAAERQFVDREALYMLGRKLGRILPAELKRLIQLNVRTLPDVVRTPFSKGINFSGEGRNRPAPLKVELERLLSSLEDQPEQIFEKRIQSFHSRQLAYVERTGFEGDLIRATVDLARLLLRRGEAGRISGARLAQEIVRDALVWRPNMPTLWFLWAQGLVKERAFQDAEDLLWNLLRRFPGEIRFRTLLVRVLLSLPDRNREALALVRENIALFETALPSAFQLAEALSRTGRLEDAKEAISVLVNHTSKSEKRYYHMGTGLIARLLIDTLTKFSADLDDIMPDFPNDTLAGSVASVALKFDPASPVARRIFWRLLEADPSNAKTRNNLAKALLESGDQKDATEAETILRATLAANAGDRYAAGMLVRLLQGREGPGWHAEALRILEDARQVESHERLDAQYAALLSLGDEGQRNTAKDLLDDLHATHPADPYIRLALAHWYLQDNAEGMRERVAPLLQPLAADPAFRRAAIELFERAGISSKPVEGFPESAHDVQEEEIADLIGEVDHVSVEPDREVPPELRRWGTLRHMRFLRDNGLMDEISAMPMIDPADVSELTYVNVLEARDGRPLDSDVVSGSFQIALEVAVYNKDSIALDLLSKKFPRFASIVLLAKAAMGDLTSQSIVNSMLARPFSNDVVDQVVVTRLGKLGNGPLNFVERGSDITRVLNDLNEMTLPELMAA